MFPFSVKIFHSTTGELDFTEADALASRVLDHQMRHELNYPKELTVVLSNLETDSTRNYLGDDFDGWTGTYEGPIMVGDIIQYDTIQMDTSTGSYSTKEETFFGVITELSQGTDQSLIIKAKDFLERFEHISVSKTVFANYRDNLPCEWALVDSEEAGSKLAIKLPETTLAYPAVKCQFGANDTIFDICWNIASINSYACLYQEMMCQSFIAPTNGIYFFSVAYRIVAGSWLDVNGHCKVHIYKDNGSNRPDLTQEVSVCEATLIYVTNPTEWQDTPVTDSVEILQLDQGAKYWICFENHNGTDAGATLGVVYDPSGLYLSDGTAAHCYHRTSGGTYTEVNGNLVTKLWQVELNDCSPDEYHYETISGTGYIILDKSPGKWTTDIIPTHGSDFGTHLKRGLMSYYYGTKQVHEVMDAIIPLDYEYFKDSSNRWVDTNIDMTVPLYRTKGKALGTCLRELCDLIAWQSGKQCSMAVLRPHGETYQQLRISYRNDTSSSTEHTFGPANFIETIDATMTSVNRPCRIVVIGKTTAKGTITATVEDDDWKAQCKFTTTETIQDDTIQTVSDAFARARGTLESYRRGIWEGSMRLAGVFPQLMHDHYEYGNPKWGDGAIIEVTWPELGWSSLKLKVTGTTLGPDYTDVRFSNADVLLNNKFVRSMRSQQRSESFVSPTDSEAVLYLPIYSASGWSSDMFIDLSTATSTPITNYRLVKGTAFNTTNPTRRIWHFEIDAKNGYTADGTPITAFEFYPDYAKSWKILTWDFATYLSSSYNFYKWKSTKVIIDFVMDPS